MAGTIIRVSDDLAAPVNVRAEVWAAVEVPWKQGMFEHAIFDAFKYVEAEVQRRIGSAAIGDRLLTAAFDPATGPKIDVTANPLDGERVTELFQACVGLFKGSRSHGGEAPSIPAADDLEFATRVLVVASALLDLLDRDANLAPAFRGRPQVDGSVLTLWVDRITPTVRVEIDAQDAEVRSRIGDCLEVSLSGLSAGSHEVLLRDGARRSRPQPFAVLSEPLVTNWHRVLKTALPIYADAACTESRAEVAILLESLEGGKHHHRVFPTTSEAQPGDYVSWDWIGGPPLPESWIKLDGETYYAWTWSTLFAGLPTSPTEPERVTRIQLRPRRVQLRPGGCLPIRVLVSQTDGVASWDTPIASRISVSSTDHDLAYVQNNRIIRAKKPGRCVVRADALEMHTEVEVVVAAYPRETVTEYLGGVQHPRDVAVRDGDLFVVDNSETIWTMSDHAGLSPFATVELPFLAASGLDQVAISPAGSVAVRDLSKTAIRLYPEDRLVPIRRAAPPG